MNDNSSRHFFICLRWLKYKQKVVEKNKFTNKKPLGYFQYSLLFVGEIFLFVILPVCLIGLIIGKIKGKL